MHLCKLEKTDAVVDSQKGELETHKRCVIIYAILHGRYDQPCSWQLKKFGNSTGSGNAYIGGGGGIGLLGWEAEVSSGAPNINMAQRRWEVKGQCSSSPCISVSQSVSQTHLQSTSDSFEKSIWEGYILIT